MVVIKEFSSVRYNLKKLKQYNLTLGDVVCPPYDIISPDMHKKLLSKKYNFVHLELPEGKGEKKYLNAKKTLSLWKRNKILIEEKFPAIYISEEKFSYPVGSDKKLVRRGIFCLVEVDPEYKTIIPHEETRPKPVEDRFKLLSMLKFQTSAIFCLVDDKGMLSSWIEKIVHDSEPEVVFSDMFCTEHRLYAVRAKEKILWLEKFFKDKNLIIADGHHRYRTACEYLKSVTGENVVDKSSKRVHKGKLNTELLENAKYIMSYICPISDEGLLILPTHRAVAGEFLKSVIEENFILHNWDGKKPVDLVLYHKGEFKVMIPKKIRKKLLPVVLLAENVLNSVPKEQIFYHQEVKEITSFADRYNGYGFLVSPVSKDIFNKIVSQRKVLPAKTTYFYPKVISGGVGFKVS